MVVVSRLLRRLLGPADLELIAPEKFGWTLTNQFFTGTADPCIAQRAILDPGDGRRVVHKHLESLLGFSQCLLGVALLADVARDAAIAVEGAMLIKHG